MHLRSALLAQTPGFAPSRAGRKIWLQPHAQIFALFDDKVTSRGVMDGDRYLPYNGVPAIYNFTGMLRDHRYFWLASTLFPASLATWTSHLPADEHVALMRRFHYVSSITVTIERSCPLARSRARPAAARLTRAGATLKPCAAASAMPRGPFSPSAPVSVLPMLDPPRIERESDLRSLDRLDCPTTAVALSDHTSGGCRAGPRE